MPATTQAFLDALQARSPLDPDAARALSGLLRPRRFEAQDWLLQPGQRAQEAFFLVEGLVREFYVDEQGREHTRSFACDGEFTGSLLDLLSDAPALTCLQALEDSSVLSFSYAAFDALCLQHATLERLARRVAETLYVRKARREYELLALSAAERYRRWLHERPGLESRISQRVIASYLGITPVHLSRLRRQPASTPLPAAASGSR